MQQKALGSDVLPQKGRLHFREKEYYNYIALSLVDLRTQWGVNELSMLIKSHHSFPEVLLSALNYRGNSHTILN